MDRETNLAALRTMMASLGLTEEDLLSAPGTARITFGEFVTTEVLPGLTKGSRTAWGTSIATAMEGLPGLCACLCERCLNSYRGDSQWTPCSCVAAGECSCDKKHLAGGPVAATSCLEHCVGIADQEFAAITLSQLEQLSHWAQLRALKRTLVRNRNRAQQGRAPYTHDGRSAVESLRAFLSAAYKLARGDRKTGVTYNIALDMRRYPRPEVQKRSYSADRLEEIWQALFTSGSDDVWLDTNLVCFILETGARRSAPMKSTIADMLVNEGRVRLSEKNNKVNEQPISPRLMEAILRQAIERGDVVLSAPEDWDPADFTLEDLKSRRVVLRPDAPLFYYRRPQQHAEADGSVTQRPRPLTNKRFETLWNRLKRDLPWLDDIHGRPHDLRKTVGTLIERAYGHATAKAFLRHGIDNTTDIYTAAGLDEVLLAHAWLIGDGSFTDGLELP